MSAQKDYVLLVLHFELRPSACAQLDRERLVVSEAEGKEYRYGGWRVEDAQYELCREPAASLIHGPWDNEFWDPLAIRPKLGSLDLVFPVSAKATKLTFTDGVVEIDLHTPRKP